MTVPDFELKSGSGLSAWFNARGMHYFSEACAFVRHLPYGRNSNKMDLLSVLKESCGTCSTKHAVLKTLATESGVNELQLILGFFKMNAANTPLVAGTLKKYGLDYIPEAHNYLKCRGQIFDFTGAGFSPDRYGTDILDEIEISVDQIDAYKIKAHQEYLRGWLESLGSMKYSLQEIWAIREQCIHDLSK